MDDIKAIVTEPFFTAEFGKTLAKTFIISAVTTAGMFGGLAAVGFVIDRKEKRKAAKDKTSKTETPIVES